MVLPPASDCPSDRRARAVVLEISSEHAEAPPVGTAFVLDRSPFFFGWTSSCMPDPRDVAVHGRGMSRAHAFFELRDDGWWVHDGGSTNGTWVDGDRIAVPTKLANGSRVTLGVHGGNAGERGVTFEFCQP